MNYSLKELNAVLEGLAYKRIDEQEMLAVLAANVRVAMNKKKLKITDLFNRRKMVSKIKQTFTGQKIESNYEKELAERIRLANEHFKNK